MKRRPWIIAGALLLLALGVFWLGAFRGQTPDPLYQDRPLSQWLGAISVVPVTTPGRLGAWNDAHEHARKAVLYTGTNALPRLLVMLAAHEPPWQGKLRAQLSRLPFAHWLPPSVLDQNQRGLEGMCILGPEARSAVPALLALYAQAPPHRNLHQTIPAVLAAIGPAAVAGVPLLAHAVTNEPSAAAKLNAVIALGQIGVATDLALTNLTVALADPDPEVRAVAASALGQMGSLASPTLPALCHLRDSSPPSTHGPIRQSYYLDWSSSPARTIYFGSARGDRCQVQAAEAIRKLTGEAGWTPWVPAPTSPP